MGVSGQSLVLPAKSTSVIEIAGRDLPFKIRPCMRRIGHDRSSGKLGTGIDVTPASALAAVHPIELGLSGS
jgi:hypothetical protein